MSAEIDYLTSRQPQVVTKELKGEATPWRNESVSTHTDPMPQPQADAKHVYNVCS